MVVQMRHLKLATLKLLLGQIKLKKLHVKDPMLKKKKKNPMLLTSLWFTKPSHNLLKTGLGYNIRYSWYSIIIL